MSKYYIKTITNIYQDNYEEEGEGKFVNQYGENGVIEAKNAKRAIDSFLKEKGWTQKQILNDVLKQWKPSDRRCATTQRQTNLENE